MVAVVEDFLGGTYAYAEDGCGNDGEGALQLGFVGGISDEEDCGALQLGFVGAWCLRIMM